MQEKSKKILILTSAFRPFIGGSEIAIEEICKRLPGFDFDVVTPRYSRKLKSTENFSNLNIYRIGFGLSIDKFLFPVLGFFGTFNLLQNKKYEAVHVYQASYGAGAGCLIKLFFPKNIFILTLQEGKNLNEQGFWVRLFRKIIIKNSDIITAISNYLKDYAKEINKYAKLILIPNGVDIELFSKDFSYGDLSALKDKLGVLPGEKIIVSASRLVTKNGVDNLIRSLPIVNGSGSANHFRLVLLGDGSQKPELVELCKNLKILGDVIFVGSIGHNELVKYLKVSDIFVRTSRSEGLGSAFLEAMAAGIPVIATNVGGISDFLKDKTNGLFAKVDDPQDLSEKIKMLIGDKKLRETIIKNAKELVVSNYDWNKIAISFGKIYSKDQ